MPPQKGECLILTKRNIVPKVVAFGGGTGLSTMLRGLKALTPNITAVVTMADDGGSSGYLRRELGILPPGDIRNCIVALAEAEPSMKKLLQYRFSSGNLSGQCFGNLLLAAVFGISNDFEETVNAVSDVLRVTGRVLPVTVENVIIEAQLENKEIVKGESKIGKAALEMKSRIEKVRLVPADAKPVAGVLKAIEEADIIVLGPGSLYTSIIPNLIVDGVADAVKASRAVKIYVCNIMTQPGETDNMDAFAHAKAICDHAGGKIMDYCVVNNEGVPEPLLKRYIEDGAQIVEVHPEQFISNKIKLVELPCVHTATGNVRHDYQKLAKGVFDIYSKHLRQSFAPLLNFKGYSV
ncbi:MAG: Gluconeogenesis factor [Firmicutes bacterium ADurb.Bin193]|nr:MAG: Gluconeogenesis factor [Firmicutes bacterium ADurb.Bin193]